MRQPRESLPPRLVFFPPPQNSRPGPIHRPGARVLVRESPPVSYHTPAGSGSQATIWPAMALAATVYGDAR
jgi:hypothetical protein